MSFTLKPSIGAAIFVAGLYFVSSAFGQALKPIQAGDFFAVTFGNEIWRLPAGDTSGIGETYTRPPTGGSLWGVATDKDANLYYVYEIAPSHVLVKVTAAGVSQTVVTMPLSGTQYFVEDFTASESGTVYILFRSKSAADAWIVRVGSDGKAIDHRSGQEVRGPFTSQSFPAGSYGKLAINSAGEVYVLTRNIGGAASGIRLNLAPAGAAIQSLGTLTDIYDIEFSEGQLWGARSTTGGSPTDLVKITLSPFTVEPKGTFTAYPILKAGSAILVGELQALKVALDTFASTIIKCSECHFTRSQNYTTVSGEVCPASLWDPNCVIIERGEIELNGAKWHKKGSKTAAIIKDGKLFGTIQDAANFVGEDFCTKVDLSLRSGDIIRLCAASFKENVTVPESNPRTGPLEGISIIGEGRDKTIWEEPSVLVILNFLSGHSLANPNQLKALKLEIPGSGVKVKSGLKASDVYFHGIAGSYGIDFDQRAVGTVDNCTFDNFGTGISAGRDLDVRETKMMFVRTGIEHLNIDQTSGRVSVSGLEVQGDFDKLIDLRNVHDSRLSDIKMGPFGFKTDAVNLLDCDNVTLETSDLFGNRYAIAISDSKGIKVQNCKISSSLAGVGLAVFGQSEATVRGNRIIYNGRAGLLRDRRARVKEVTSNLFAHNGGGVVSDDVIFGAPSAGELALASDPDLFESNVFIGNTEDGILLKADGGVDLGGGVTGSKGGNIFARNGKFDVTNQSGARISAKHNVWESSDPTEIMAKYVSAGTGGIDVAPVADITKTYFAQFVELDGYTSTATFANPSRTAGAAGTLSLRKSTGELGNPKLDGLESAGGLHGVAVPALGASSLSTNPKPGQTNIGALVVSSPRKLAGTVLFSSPDAGVAGVGASELLKEFVAPIEKNVSREVNSGVALFNPSATAVTATLRLRDEFGNSKQRTLTLDPFGQTAQFIDQLFTDVTGDFLGLLIVSAPSEIAAAVLRTTPKQFATLPVTGAGSKKLLFAQIAEVQGIGSTLLVFNPSQTQTASVTVRLRDDNGAPLTVALNGTDRTGEFGFTLGPLEVARYTSPGTSTTQKVGSVVVESTENIGGVILFGGSTGVAGVGASAELRSFIAPVEESTTGSVNTSLALMNTGTAAVKVNLTLRDESGTAKETVEVRLSANGHLAKFIAQFFKNVAADFRGTVTAEADGLVAATVLRFSSTPQEFATFPVAEIR